MKYRYILHAYGDEVRRLSRTAVILKLGREGANVDHSGYDKAAKEIDRIMAKAEREASYVHPSSDGGVRKKAEIYIDSQQYVVVTATNP